MWTRTILTQRAPRDWTFAVQEQRGETWHTIASGEASSRREAYLRALEAEMRRRAQKPEEPTR